ncbi:MAG: 2-dehydropantoate 2-reductase [Pedobacter sp.]|nr:MAG: 2-dehydropantoate 2-reductase [Pedobacter sp.]
MANRTKIVIAGIGGVGGYFGGLLARTYAGMDKVEIYFIARGEHLRQIKKHGLRVIKGDTEFLAIPYLATADPWQVGIADYILICTKSYDLNDILAELKPCIDDHTVIISLLNGVESVELIREKFPKNRVPAGFAYIVAAIREPGIIENLGNRQEMLFGLDGARSEELVKLEDLLNSAGIEATYSQEISKLVWEKFIFLSCIATATSYYQKTVGQLLEHHKEYLQNLISEVKTIAIKKNIAIDEQIIAKAMTHYEDLPYTTTSSMQRDFEQKKNRTELNSITGYVVNEAKKINIETPYFENAYLALLKR